MILWLTLIQSVDQFSPRAHECKPVGALKDAKIKSHANQPYAIPSDFFTPHALYIRPHTFGWVSLFLHSRS